MKTESRKIKVLLVISISILSLVVITYFISFIRPVMKFLLTYLPLYCNFWTLWALWIAGILGISYVFIRKKGSGYRAPGRFLLKKFLRAGLLLILILIPVVALIFSAYMNTHQIDFPFLADAPQIFFNEGVYKSFENRGSDYLLYPSNDASDLSVLAFYAKYYDTASYLCNDISKSKEMADYASVLRDLARGYGYVEEGELSQAETAYKRAFEKSMSLVNVDSFKKELLEKTFTVAAGDEKTVSGKIAIYSEGARAALGMDSDNAIEYYKARVAAKAGDNKTALDIIRSLIEKDHVWRSIALHDPLFLDIQKEIAGSSES